MSNKCADCFPQIDYLCKKHRPENYCVGCTRTDQNLFISAFGILCKKCLRENGIIFV